MVKIELVPGKRYLHQGQRIVLQRVLDLQYVLGEYEATGALDRFLISQLEPDTAIDQGSGKPAEQDLLAIPDEAWQKAQRKLDAIRPVLAARGDLAIVEEAAQAAGVTVNTLYRWLRAYDQTNSVRSLVDQPRTGGKGKSRLDASLDAIIQRALETYLTRQKLPVVKVIQQVRSQCQQAGLSVPSASTVRRRVDAISEERKMQGRWGKKAAREKFEPLKGSFPGADAPLAVVQIDHTLVDVILVDEVYRKPVGRPWLTVALDV
jgi:putative transposase